MLKVPYLFSRERIVSHKTIDTALKPAFISATEMTRNRRARSLIHDPRVITLRSTVDSYRLPPYYHVAVSAAAHAASSACNVQS